MVISELTFEEAARQSSKKSKFIVIKILMINQNWVTLCIKK